MSEATSERRRSFLETLFLDAVNTSWVLFRIMVPMSLLARLMQQWGWIEPIGQALSPALSLVGLPGEMALPWAAAMLTNMYGGLATYLQLAATIPMTTAQTTVLMTMILVAHTLPVEALVARQAGARLRFTLPWRIGGALVLGMILHTIYAAGGWLQTPVLTAVPLPPPDPGWREWIVAQGRGLATVFAIILVLLTFLEVLKRTGVTALLSRALTPLLMMLGIRGEAAPLAVIGMVLGLGYGGGLIVQETRKAHIDSRDAFLSLAFLSLGHSIFEDTLLVASMGAHASGILWLRFGFAFLCVAALATTVQKYPALLRHLTIRRDTPA